MNPPIWFPNDANTEFQLDISSLNYQITNKIGLHIFWHSSFFSLDRQVIETDSIIDYQGSKNLNQDIVDIGTHVKGYYSNIIPGIYYGNHEPNSFRTGIGMGFGTIQLNGTVSFSNVSREILFRTSLADKNKTLDNHLPLLYFNDLNDISKANPFELLLISKIGRDPLALEYLGIFWSTINRVDARKSDIYVYYLSGSNRNYFELIALRGLTYHTINTGRRNSIPFILYQDFPKLLGVKTRIFANMIVAERKDYEITLTSFNIAFFVPIGLYGPKKVEKLLMKRKK